MTTLLQKCKSRMMIEFSNHKSADKPTPSCNLDANWTLWNVKSSYYNTGMTSNDIEFLLVMGTWNKLITLTMTKFAFNVLWDINSLNAKVSIIWKPWQLWHLNELTASVNVVLVSLQCLRCECSPVNLMHIFRTPLEGCFFVGALSQPISGQFSLSMSHGNITRVLLFWSFLAKNGLITKKLAQS